jgi:hypothetical protein
MKVKIDCDSPLLSYTLHKFLEEFISEDGVVITDNPEKEGIVIGKDITKPFSKTTLLLQLEKLVPIYSHSQKSSFDEELDRLISNFAKDLKKLIKDYYGEK